MQRMQAGVFSALLNRAKDMITAEADPLLTAARVSLDALVAVAAVIVVISSALLQAAVREVRVGIGRTRRMLLMLPHETATRITAIDTYLRKGVIADAVAPRGQAARATSWLTWPWAIRTAVVAEGAQQRGSRT